MRWVWNTSCTRCVLPGERGLDIAAGVGRAREHVAVEAPHRVLGVVDCGDRVDDRAERLVGDLDQLRRGPGRLLVLGDDQREHVAEVGRAPALRDEDRPVLVDEADPQLAGDVGGGEHPHDARGGLGAAVVSMPHDVGAGVRRPGAPRRAASRRGGCRRRSPCRRGRARRPRSACRWCRCRRARPGSSTRPWPGARPRRGSSRSRCSGRGGRRGGGPRSRGRGRCPSCRAGWRPARGCRGCRTRTGARRWRRRRRPARPVARWTCPRAW